MRLIVGVWIGWAIGRFGGLPLLEMHGRWLHLDEARLGRAQRCFAGFSLATVFLGRLTAVVRSFVFVSMPAGVFRVPVANYSILTLLGSAIWACALAAAGWALGSSYQTVHHDFRWVDEVVVATAVAGATAFAIRHVRRRLPRRGTPRRFSSARRPHCVLTAA